MIRKNFDIYIFIYIYIYMYCMNIYNIVETTSNNIMIIIIMFNKHPQSDQNLWAQ
jgi:hypothetical protein